jgi:hypothetical protein
MRVVVGIGLVGSLLMAGCALQPADDHDETDTTSSEISTTSTAPGVAGARVDGTRHPYLVAPAPPTSPSTNPTGTTPQSWGDNSPTCALPPCDPQPQPWGPTPLWRVK